MLDLIDLILKDDPGFRKLLYVDSGSCRFHVHVYDECVQKLVNPERREIAYFFGHDKAYQIAGEPLM